MLQMLTSALRVLVLTAVLVRICTGVTAASVNPAFWANIAREVSRNMI